MFKFTESLYGTVKTNLLKRVNGLQVTFKHRSKKKHEKLAHLDGKYLEALIDWILPCQRDNFSRVFPGAQATKKEGNLRM